MKKLFLALSIFSLPLAASETCPVLIDTQKQSLIDQHTNGFTIPDTSDLIVHRGYVYTFNKTLNVPTDVYWRAEPSFRDTPKRTGKWKRFRVDPDLVDTDLVKTSDYTHSGYHRGHMAPYFVSGGDRDGDGMDAEQEGVKGLPVEDIDDACTVFEINYMTNITPQLPEFNSQGGAWYDLETKTRGKIENGASFNIMAGTLFLDPSVNYIGAAETKIAVPDAFYKIISDGTTQTAYLFWHSKRYDPNEGCMPKDNISACIVDYSFLTQIKNK